jgi:pyruvate ferredoxin oxidoreductase alpha subunit
VIQAAVDSNFFPLYEVERGVTTINYDPEKRDKKIPLVEWFKMMGRSRHMTKPAYAAHTEDVQKEVDRRWTRLKAMAENPVL